MKMFKKIISIMMVVAMIMSFAACTQNAEEKKEEETKEEEKITITVDEAEKVVEDFLKECEKPCEFEDESKDILSDNASKQIRNSAEDYDDTKENGKIDQLSDFQYKIVSSKEKDDKIIVTVDISNKDFSFISNERLSAAILQELIDNNAFTPEEIEELGSDHPSDSLLIKMLNKIYDKYDPGMINKIIEFTVIKEDDKIKIDDIDDADDLLTVIFLNTKSK